MLPPLPDEKQPTARPYDRNSSIRDMAERLFNNDVESKSGLYQMMEERGFCEVRAKRAIEASVIFHDIFEAYVENGTDALKRKR